MDSYAAALKAIVLESRSQVEQVLLVPRASEGGYGAVGGGDLAVGGHRHIDEDKWSPGIWLGRGGHLDSGNQEMNIASP